MDNLVKTYFLEKDYNCAEAMLLILNEKYPLQLHEEDYKLLSCFGAGCGCGLLCGALAGAVSALGKMTVAERAHATPDFKETCGAFCNCFTQTMGGTQCSQLRPQYFQEGIRCAKLLEATVECFDRFVGEQKTCAE